MKNTIGKYLSFIRNVSYPNHRNISDFVERLLNGITDSETEITGGQELFLSGWIEQIIQTGGLEEYSKAAEIITFINSIKQPISPFDTTGA